MNRAFLSDIVRRTVVAAVGGEPWTVRYAPSDLKSVICRVGVTLRRGGYYRAAGVSAERPVVEACIEAANLAAKALHDSERTAEQVQQMRIEIELLSPLRKLQGNLNDIPLLRQEIVEGLEGLALHHNDVELMVRPSEWRARNLDFSQCIREMVGRTGLDRDQLARQAGNMLLFKVRSTHWVEPERGKIPEVLNWGLHLVRPEDVTRQKLEAAMAAAGRYLIYRQNQEGVFAYKYLPSQDRYAETDSWVNQAGAMWTMSRFARATRHEDAVKAADKSIKAFVPLLRPIPNRPEAWYVQLPGGGPQKLGVSALYLLAIMDHPNPEPLYPTAARIIEAVLGQQQKDGRLLADFPPGALKSSQVVYPAEALLALTRVLQVQPSKSVENALSAALPFYYEFFRDKPSTQFAAWQSMAYGAMARYTHERRYADFVFEMSDELAKLQLSPANCPWPEFHGGITLGSAGTAGSQTGLFLLGFVEAYQMAKVFGDDARARRYEEVIRSAIRFVMQLQFKPEECYYVRSRKDVVGGIRMFLTDNELELDSLAWGLGGLLSAREILFPIGK